jgi:hypothetical protein
MAETPAELVKRWYEEGGALRRAAGLLVRQRVGRGHRLEGDRGRPGRRRVMHGRDAMRAEPLGSAHTPHDLRATRALRAATLPPVSAERSISARRGHSDAARPDICVAQMAAESWGVLSLDELRACGLTKKAVGSRVRNGVLHPLHQGVYAVGHPNVPLVGRFLAAVKACGPSAVLSHYSAAALFGFVEWDDRYPEVTVAGSHSRRHPRLRVHRTRSLDPRDVGKQDGIPVTAPVRTVLDLAATLNDRSLRGAIRRAQSVRQVNLSQLLEFLDQAGPRRGVARLRRIVASGPAPTRSELEDVVLDLILRGGLAHPDVNVPLSVAGRRIVPDFRWPEQRLIVEADSRTWHDSQLAREDDAERQALLEAHGERLVRVTWQQAIARPAQTLSRLRGAGAPPSSHRAVD